jgi:hypothetical protein
LPPDALLRAQAAAAAAAIAQRFQAAAAAAAGLPPPQPGAQLPPAAPPAPPEDVSTDFDVNDLPPLARGALTKRGAQEDITRKTGCIVHTRRAACVCVCVRVRAFPRIQP